ncbi:CyaA/EF/ExoY family adenylyl cyclase toxin [Trinickia sp. LjRoot230]|uniref:anthrax toxin-like adenylyl cyclase domain-containing protein n=1 Tax=Trinickia sp. LjRoot230 TaxID=3342288 RepID=UPI003ECD7EC5
MLSARAFNEYEPTAGFHARHVAAFKDVCMDTRMVIASRELNPFCTDLMMDGYAAKGLHIKAKTCDWGPMAGFVLLDPRFTKARQSFAKQQAAVAAAIAAGAGAVPLVISDSRVRALMVRGMMARTASSVDVGRRGVEVVAHSSDTGEAHRFLLLRSAASEHWAIWYKPRGSAGAPRPAARPDTFGQRIVAAGWRPLCGLTNPGAAATGAGFKAAVCGDYDLWCLFAHTSEQGAGIHDRAMPRGSFVVPKVGAGVARRAHQAGLVYADAREREHAAKTMGNKQLGNISWAVDRVRRQLNRACRPGNDVVLHGDYGGFALGEIDYPLIFFIPLPERGFRAAETALVRNVTELTDTLRLIRKLGFIVEVNPSWAISLWK